ncbi:hypothetical protein GCK72_004303 [Caenorhabditis remanei]|uniref:Uncharacterized protein n=1 Tax=Caenorhabditis remanei TaxID=31234 RepID=A0A6A5HBZ9_CAERE|nr:hypothetical protein GCK72_004303 [Caenorhabditis remanei]KAF1764356.1 hypothetical protein GCK72_004303 [Caenorhabditis remanei]
MTTLSKPLFLGPSKCIALYMDPNKRLQLYLRCPSFGIAHKSEAIRIRDLKVRPDNFEINGTIYRLGVITQYTETPNPRSVAVDNAKRGVQENIDIYGLPPRQTQDEAENVELDNGEMARLKEKIDRMEQNNARQGFPGHGISSQLGRRTEIQRLSLKAEAYNMRINNTLPPFRHYLQLTISTGDSVKIERVVYDKQFGTGKEYIEKIVFGNKKVQVENLQIGADKDFNDYENNFGIQRGPSSPEPLFQLTPQADSVKPLLSIRSLKVSVLKVTCILTNALASLRPILSQTPLKELKALCHENTFPEDPIVNTAQFLEIAKFCPINVLSNRPNYRIHIGHGYNHSQNDDDLINLVNEWKKREIPVGTYYSIGARYDYLITAIFRTFRNMPGAKYGENEETRLTNYPECIIVPMGNNTELNAYRSEPTEVERDPFSSIVTIKWHPRGYARAVE